MNETTGTSDADQAVDAAEDSPAKRAVEAAGGAGKVAELLGISRISVYEWIYKNRVPAERVIPLELAGQGRVPRHEIRPDLYPPPASLTA